ncbi:MAG TPA: RDD family protein [Candidatus Izemoplasmatales bacterium]|nr:RDD family protein [Candidatus Izemoplasmatales bacterium]
MRAGYLRRLTSALIDLIVVVLIVYLAFTLFGRSIIQNRVDNYDVIEENLQEVLDVRNDNLEHIDQLDTDAEDQREQIAVINHLSSFDESVYERLLTRYYTETVYFYIIGITLLLSVMVIALNGLTLGRRVMRIELVGNVNLFNVIIHDLLLKYILIVALVAFNLYYAFIIIPLYFLIDLFLIVLTKNKATLRDTLSKIVVNVKPKNSIEN